MEQEIMAKLENYDSYEGIAIIGMAGRFPKANNTSEFWRNLRDGIECITFFSDRELKQAGIEPALLQKPNYVKARGVLEGIDLFDAAFFGFSSRESEIMDPHHRLLLECAWEALEDAGYDSERFPGRIGIFAGQSLNSYLLLNVFPSLDRTIGVGSLQAAIGNDKDSLTTNISYRLNLKGPGITIQSSSSTSLVAVCIACQSLLTYQSDMALAGGVTADAQSICGYLYEEGGIVSPDGHCRTFDAKAQGFVPGSGMGIVVLKRLAEALKDGDQIYAVIKGNAINNDGSAKVSYTAPSVDGQAEVIAEAQALAGFNPETITYIEAHGTGTNMGDPIEVAALTQAFRAGTAKKRFCALGSVKSNVGHLDTAAGVTGLIKTALALKHKQIPPSLHFEKANPKIDFENSPFYVNTKLTEWKTDGFPRRAGVTSLGMGGTNAHVVLEEAPAREDSGPSRAWQLWLLSAKTKTALEQATVNLVKHLKGNPALNPADVAYTLQVGRREHHQRRMAVCRGIEDGCVALEQLDPSRVITADCESGGSSVVFMFSGQGAQYVNMGLGLYREETFFREQVDRCSELLKPELGIDPRTVIYPREELTETAAEQLKQTAITQPALFIIEYALARLWMKWGIQPQAMIGHSIGEYTAACLAGVFKLEDALKLVALRGRLMQSLPEEAMPDPILETFTRQVAKIKLNPPQIPLISNVTGKMVTAGEMAEPGYWTRHLRQTVCFSAGITSLLQDPKRILLEVGPGQTLATLAKQHLANDSGRIILTSIWRPDQKQPDEAFLLDILGRLWLAGIPVNWNRFYGEEERSRVSLPTYPFERRHYWIEPPKMNEGSLLVKSTPVIIKEQAAGGHSEIQKRLAQIWGKVLGLNEVSIHANFYELGGDSIMSVQVIADLPDLKLEATDFFQYPTIAELSQYIETLPVSREPAELPKTERMSIAGSFTDIPDVKQSQILENIVPFNEVLYKDCFYNAFFPIIYHFNRDLHPFLADDLFIYQYHPAKQGIKIDIDYLSFKGMERILNELGINVDQKLVSDNLAHDLIQTLAAQKLAILRIDCYYEPIRYDTYQETHWEHCLLVYGYDQTSRVFYILEHDDLNSLTYKPQTISYQDLFQAYQGYLTNFQKGQAIPSYYEFGTIENSSANILPAVIPVDQKPVFGSNILAQKEQLLGSLDSLLGFKADLERLVTDETLLAGHLEELIYIINKILKAKAGERYQISILLDAPANLSAILDNIIAAWNYLKITTEKYKYSKVFRLGDFTTGIGKLDRIFQLEHSYNEELFSIL
jgi:acyl transferase domain-containing protein